MCVYDICVKPTPQSNGQKVGVCEKSGIRWTEARPAYYTILIHMCMCICIWAVTARYETGYCFSVDTKCEPSGRITKVDSDIVSEIYWTENVDKDVPLITRNSWMV